MGTEKSSEYYDDIFLNHEAYGVHYSQFGRFSIFQNVLKIIKKEFQSSEVSILELGCGTGQFAHYLQDEKYTNYLGLDFSEMAIEKGKQICHQRFQKVDCVKENVFENKNFDVIVAMEFFEHIAKDISVLQQIPSDKFIILGLPKFDCESHVRHFPKEQKIYKRYEKLINIKEIRNFSKWFLVSGKKI